MSGSPASMRRTASPIMGWSSISKTVTLCWVKTGSVLMREALDGSSLIISESHIKN